VGACGGVGDGEVERTVAVVVADGDAHEAGPRKFMPL